MNHAAERQLMVIVADLDAENVFRVLLTQRQPSLGIRVAFNGARLEDGGDVLRYVHRDAGCYRDAVSLARAGRAAASHVLLVFDRHGSGNDNSRSREAIEAEIEALFQKNHLKNCGVVVIDPELDAWAWSSPRAVAENTGFDSAAELQRELQRDPSLWKTDQPTPCDPKRALQEACRRKKQHRYSAPLFKSLAEEAGLKQCQDPAFQKLIRLLQNWFGSVPDSNAPSD